MWRQTGETAGIVYEYLALEGPKAFPELLRGVNVPEPLAWLALGWLLREDKVEFREEGRACLK